MRSRGSPSGGGGRPSGSDGTDHPFRMTIDSRYKKVVEKKLQLQKLLIAQTVFHLIKTIEVILMVVSGNLIASTTVATCCLGGVAILSGTLGLKWTSFKVLQLFIFATSATIMLSAFPLISGYTKAFRAFQGNAGFKLLAFDGLEVAQELMGVILHLVEVVVGLSLLHHIARRRA